jgi:hypothetical protein
MNEQFPDDDDGHALRRVQEDGADMSRPMRIEFSIAAPAAAIARSIAEHTSARGYVPKISVDDESGAVSVYCAKTMLATYDGVIAGQAELNEICAPMGAECDGWFPAGNHQDH